MMSDLKAIGLMCAIVVALDLFLTYGMDAFADAVSAAVAARIFGF